MLLLLPCNPKLAGPGDADPIQISPEIHPGSSLGAGRVSELSPQPTLAGQHALPPPKPIQVALTSHYIPGCMFPTANYRLYLESVWEGKEGEGLGQQGVSTVKLVPLL